MSIHINQFKEEFIKAIKTFKIDDDIRQNIITEINNSNLEDGNINTFFNKLSHDRQKQILDYFIDIVNQEESLHLLNISNPTLLSFIAFSCYRVIKTLYKKNNITETLLTECKDSIKKYGVQGIRDLKYTNYYNPSNNLESLIKNMTAKFYPLYNQLFLTNLIKNTDLYLVSLTLYNLTPFISMMFCSSWSKIVGISISSTLIPLICLHVDLYKNTGNYNLRTDELAKKNLARLLYLIPVSSYYFLYKELRSLIEKSKPNDITSDISVKIYKYVQDFIEKSSQSEDDKTRFKVRIFKYQDKLEEIIKNSNQDTIFQNLSSYLSNIKALVYKKDFSEHLVNVSKKQLSITFQM